jgi:hypothetical protein
VGTRTIRDTAVRLGSIKANRPRTTTRPVRDTPTQVSQTMAGQVTGVLGGLELPELIQTNTTPRVVTNMPRTIKDLPGIITEAITVASQTMVATLPTTRSLTTQLSRLETMAAPLPCMRQATSPPTPANTTATSNQLRLPTLARIQPIRLTIQIVQEARSIEALTATFGVTKYITLNLLVRSCQKCSR